jgi:hypothetical protein
MRRKRHQEISVPRTWAEAVNRRLESTVFGGLLAALRLNLHRIYPRDNLYAELGP